MTSRPWPRALAWLLFLGPFFFLTYNFANVSASHRAHVAVLAFPWERYIPFIGWTILPYWSSDLLYALSLGICRTRDELDRHGKRLVAIQIFSTACFLAFPLRCGFERPPVSWWVAGLFAALHSFDQPFNQAPSLHVGLAVILWTRFRAHSSAALRVPLAAYFVLMAASTLTTHQHQFIDVPMGAWAGLLVLAAVPERRVADPQIRLTLLYLAGAIACTTAAFTLRGFGWVLLWPGFALSMVAAAYWTGDSAWFGNRLAGILMLPYTVAAWINSRLWTRGEAAKNHLTDAVWIGRAPSTVDRDGMNSVVQLAPELRIRGDAHVAMLDLSPPTEDQLDEAVRAIQQLAGQRPTLVCCALGYSRSAVASAAWLISAGHAANAEDALAQVRRARPQVMVGPKFKLRLEQWARRNSENAG
jgi:Dual specificity phosphatase, catalytic domain/PAP2 superfamily